MNSIKIQSRAVVKISSITRPKTHPIATVSTNQPTHSTYLIALRRPTPSSKSKSRQINIMLWIFATMTNHLRWCTYSNRSFSSQKTSSVAKEAKQPFTRQRLKIMPKRKKLPSLRNHLHFCYFLSITINKSSRKFWRFLPQMITNSCSETALKIYLYIQWQKEFHASHQSVYTMPPIYSF